MVTAAVSDLFFNFEKPTLTEYFQNNDFDYYSDTVHNIIKEEAEGFIALLESAAGAELHIEPTELVRDFINRI